MPFLRWEDFLQAKDKSQEIEGSIMAESDKKIQDMQIIEETLHNILLQKQAFQMELSETISAIGEVKNSKDDLFKIIGQIMLKTSKSKILEELENKERILNLRIKSLEKQENTLNEKFSSIRDEIFKSSSPKK